MFTLISVNQTEREEYADMYSDFYKDAHGVRPRFDTSAWSLEDFKAEFALLGAICRENEAEREASEAAAIVAFEALVTRLIGMGATDRAMAIRWLADAEGTGEDREYLCYSLGLPYHYFAA